MLKAYKFRLYPNIEQEVFIAKHFGCCRWVWNYTLNKKIEAYKKDKTKLSCYDLKKELPILKKSEETKWLKEVNSISLQAILLNQDKAFKKFFKDKKGFPKFKTKKNEQSFQCPQNVKIDFENNKIFLPKFETSIKIVLHRKFEGKIKTTTIRQTTSGKYYASVLVETLDNEIQSSAPDIKEAIGLDLGIKDFLILNDGTKIPNPKYLKKSLKQLKRLQRNLSRKVKGSNNRNKAKKILAVKHEKVSNQRLDFLHKLSHQLVCKNQAKTICIEDLNVKGMLGNHKLAQVISDVSWNKFIELLNYKCNWYGKNLIKIGRFETSSKTCSHCNFKNEFLKLSDREWTCLNCEIVHDRDINAAKNVLKFAFKIPMDNR